MAADRLHTFSRLHVFTVALLIVVTIAAMICIANPHRSRIVHIVAYDALIISLAGRVGLLALGTGVCWYDIRTTCGTRTNMLQWSTIAAIASLLIDFLW